MECSAYFFLGNACSLKLFKTFDEFGAFELFYAMCKGISLTLLGVLYAEQKEKIYCRSYPFHVKLPMGFERAFFSEEIQA